MSIFRIRNKRKCKVPAIKSVEQIEARKLRLSWEGETDSRLEYSLDNGVSYRLLSSLVGFGSSVEISSDLLLSSEDRVLLFRIVSHHVECGERVSASYRVKWLGLTEVSIVWSDGSKADRVTVEDHVGVKILGGDMMGVMPIWEAKHMSGAWVEQSPINNDRERTIEIEQGATEIRLKLNRGGEYYYTNILKVERMEGCSNYYAECEEDGAVLVYKDCSGEEKRIEGANRGMEVDVITSVYICASELKEKKGWSLTRIGSCDDSCKRYELKLLAKPFSGNEVSVKYLDCSGEEQEQRLVVPIGVVGGTAEQNEKKVSFCGRRILSFKGDREHVVRVLGACEESLDPSEEPRFQSGSYRVSGKGTIIYKDKQGARVEKTLPYEEEETHGYDSWDGNYFGDGDRNHIVTITQFNACISEIEQKDDGIILTRIGDC